MAYCRQVRVGDAVAMVRFSGRPPAPCSVCLRRDHTKLCDAILKPGEATRGKAGSPTCDRELCDGCATGDGQQDFCPTHKGLAG